MYTKLFNNYNRIQMDILFLHSTGSAETMLHVGSQKISSDEPGLVLDGGPYFKSVYCKVSYLFSRKGWD